MAKNNESKNVSPILVGISLFMQTVTQDKDGNWVPKRPQDLENPELGNISAIAKHVDVSSAVLTKRIAQMGFDTSIHQGKSATPLPVGEELKKLCAFYSAGNSLADTGEEFGLSPQRTREALVEAGTPIRSAGRAGLEKPEKETLEQVFEQSGEVVSATADLLYEMEVKQLIADGVEEDVARKAANRPSDSTVSTWLDADGIREKGTRRRYMTLDDSAPDFATATAEELNQWAESVDLSAPDASEDRSGFIIAAVTHMANAQ